MAAVADRTAGRQLGQQRLEHRLPFGRGQAGQVTAVEMQQVEDVIALPLRLAAGERILQGGQKLVTPSSASTAISPSR
jgi:hypothetical protein